MVVALALLAVSCGTPAGNGDTLLGPPAGSSATTTSSLPPDVGTTTVPEPPGPVPAGPAPWDLSPIPIEEVAEVLAGEWERGEGACSALYPRDPSVIPWDAAIRPADFGSDSWAVAWDLPDGPGREPSGAYCASCGRGAFGVAGAGLVVDGDESDIWPNRLAWDDGSLAGYGLEGLDDAAPGAPLLMYLLVKEEGCLYNLWSFLGEDHLLALVASLRRVEGLVGPPVPWRSDLPPPELREMGDPPWVTEPALAPDSIAPVYLEEWEGEAGAPPRCPLLVLSDLGEPATGAVPRRAASEGEMLIAFDRPSGPGHTGMGEPCTDCGRGAVGLGTFQFYVPAEARITHRWQDGSVGDLDEGPYGTEMHLQPAGFDCTYWLWSHLGPEHLEYLLTALRRVEGHP
jgi:hypothetical protein